MRAVGVGVFVRALLVFVGLSARAARVLVRLLDRLGVLALALLGDFLRGGLALVDVLVVQLHREREHRGGALRLAVGGGGGALDLLQTAGLGVGLDLGHLVAQLLFALLGLFELLAKFLDLCVKLLHTHGLLVCGAQLAAQVLSVGAELVALLTHRVEFGGQIRLVRVLRGLGGELVDLRGQALDLRLELFVLRGEGAVVLLGLRELALRGLGGLVRLGDLRLCLLALPLCSGGLERLILLRKRLHLCGQLGDLGIEGRDIWPEGLRGLAAGNGLLAQSLNGFSDLIEEVVYLVNVIPFLETHRLKGVLPNILRRQKSHISSTSLWACARLS